MLRVVIALLAVVVAGGTAESADRALARHGWQRAAVILPAGLPRPHYRFRTTISYGAPYPYRPAYGPQLPVYGTPETLYAIGYVDTPYLTPLGAPLLPLWQTLPGDYGSTYIHDYQGPYYSGRYVGYGDRLPYPCGVYGNC